MEISLLNTSKTITALDMKKDFVDKIDLSVQERKSWCNVCCWNTSDFKYILNRLHPGILQLWIGQNMHQKWRYQSWNKIKANISRVTVTQKIRTTFLVLWKFQTYDFSGRNVLDHTKATIPSFSDLYRPNRSCRHDPATYAVFGRYTFDPQNLGMCSYYVLRSYKYLHFNSAEIHNIMYVSN